MEEMESATLLQRIRDVAPTRNGEPISEAHFALLARLVEHEDVAIRGEALNAIVDAGRNVEADVLVRLLRRPTPQSPTVVLRAVLAYCVATAEFPAPNDLERVALQGDEGERLYAVMALVRIDGYIPSAALVESLLKDEAHIRSIAADLLGPAK